MEVPQLDPLQFNINNAEKSVIIAVSNLRVSEFYTSQNTKIIHDYILFVCNFCPGVMSITFSYYSLQVSETNKF